MLSPEKNCAVCSRTRSPYKCPKCQIRYCSSTCFKIHRDSKNCNLTKLSEIFVQEETIISGEDSNFGPKILSDYQKETLLKSVYIQEMLKSKRLRCTLRVIDQATDRQAVLKRMRQVNPEFDTFISSMMTEVTIRTTSVAGKLQGK